MVRHHRTAHSVWCVTMVMVVHLVLRTALRLPKLGA